MGTLYRTAMIGVDNLSGWCDVCKEKHSHNPEKYQSGIRSNENNPFNKKNIDHNQNPLMQNADALCTPAALILDRTNERMLHQGSVFTLHGGKKTSN